MHLFMFDIDGTLVQSYDFDKECFLEAVHEVLGITISGDWSRFPDVTDSGIVQQLLADQSSSRKKQTLAGEIEECFVDRLGNKLRQEPLHPVPGAADFLNRLQERDDCTLALATGGWERSARLKLAAAGINVGHVPLASASDHHQRVEIMKLAEQRIGQQHYRSRTYFGDGPWDRRAADVLNYEFVLIGNRINHSPAIPDFTRAERLFQDRLN